MCQKNSSNKKYWQQTSDGNDNKIQMFIKWLKDEWNGSKIGIADIKVKFEISDKYWGKLNRISCKRY